jgi:hypothetical protein
MLAGAFASAVFAPTHFGGVRIDVEPLTGRDIALQLFTERGLNPTAHDQRLGVALRLQRDKVL